MDMVTSVTNFGRSGLVDWLAQRISGVVLLLYVVFLTFFLLTNPALTFNEWEALFQQNWMRTFSLLALLSMIVHAWVGLWSVTTDYITTRQLGAIATPLRLSLQGIAALIAFYYLLWGIQILWGI